MGNICICNGNFGATRMSDISKTKLERARERLEKNEKRIYRNLKDVTTTNPNSSQQRQQQSQSEKHQKRFSTSTPFHSFSISLSLPTSRGSLPSPLRFSKEFDSARAKWRRDRDFQVRIEGIEGICRVLVASLERNTIFRRDWEGFGSFLHLELECGFRLRFLGFFHGFGSRENALAVWGAIDEKLFLVVETWYVVLIMRLLHVFSLTWLPFAWNVLEK